MRALAGATKTTNGGASAGRDSSHRGAGSVAAQPQCREDPDSNCRMLLTLVTCDTVYKPLVGNESGLIFAAARERNLSSPAN
jgi:hypothetical protein